jgi:hypothetical protein
MPCADSRGRDTRFFAQVVYLILVTNWRSAVQGPLEGSEPGLATARAPHNTTILLSKPRPRANTNPSVDRHATRQRRLQPATASVQ